MKKKIKLAAFLTSVIVWIILVLISSMFIGDLTWELTYEIYGYGVSPFISTTLGVLVFYIGFGFASDKEE